MGLRVFYLVRGTNGPILNTAFWQYNECGWEPVEGATSGGTTTEAEVSGWSSTAASQGPRPYEVRVELWGVEDNYGVLYSSHIQHIYMHLL